MAQGTRETRQVQATTKSVESMGQLLLQGYCMLADGCAECMVPLMRNPEGTKDICVHCGKVIPVTKEYSPDDTGETGMKSQHETGAGQDTPALLAERMVQGWKMLSEHCPICSTPLLEKKNEGMYCVSCDMPVRNKPDSVGEQGVGDIGERQKGGKAVVEDSVRIAELKRSVVTHILEYMNSISLSLVHSPRHGEYDSEEPIHPGKIVSQLSECADIVSKIDSLAL